MIWLIVVDAFCPFHPSYQAFKSRPPAVQCFLDIFSVFFKGGHSHMVKLVGRMGDNDEPILS